MDNMQPIDSMNNLPANNSFSGGNMQGQPQPNFEPVQQVQPSAMPPINYTEMPKNDNKFSVNSFLNSLNWVEVFFGIVGSAALFYTIYYYRYKIQIDQLINRKLQAQIDTLNNTVNEIKNNIQDANSGNGWY